MPYSDLDATVRGEYTVRRYELKFLSWDIWYKNCCRILEETGHQQRG